LRRRAEKKCRERYHDGHNQDAEADHTVPPAIGSDRPLEDWRPRRTCHVLSARNKSQRGPAPNLEPSGDIDIKRRVDRGVAQNAKEEPVSDVELPSLSARGEHQPGAHHGGPKHDDGPDAESFGEPPHRQSTKSGPKHAKRESSRRYGAVTS